MEICCDGGADVLGPSNTVGDGGTGGVGDAGDVWNEAVVVGAGGGAIWGSSVSSTGWSTSMSSATS